MQMSMQIPFAEQAERHLALTILRVLPPRQPLTFITPRASKIPPRK